MKFLTPRQRRILSYLTSGALTALAARQAAKGSLRNAHFMAIAGTAAFLLPTLVRNSSFFGPVMTRFPTKEREVWLTIDDGPDPHDTPQILDILARFNARATFFGIGEKIERWPHLALAVTQAGHQLQNHTFTHPASSFWATTPARARGEIMLCSEAIGSIVGKNPTQFRAPAGLANPFVHGVLEHLGLQMIGWSACGYDGIPHSPERVVQKILSSVAPGSIILIHEGPLWGLHAGTRARTLEKLLKALTNKGFKTTIPNISS